MKDMSQIDLKFDSEQNAFGLTDDFDDLYIQKSQPVANGWLLVILDFNTHKTMRYWQILRTLRQRKSS